MAKKYQLDGKVIANEWVTASYFKMTLSFETLPEILPGQFAELRIDQTPSVFLRRPISIHDVRPETNQVDLLIQKVGDGTAWLSERKPGDIVNNKALNSIGTKNVPAGILLINLTMLISFFKLTYNN